MPKLLRVIKTDGSQHFLPVLAKAQILQQNNLLPANQKWKVEEVDEALAKGHKFIADGHISAGDASKVILLKDERIKELEAALAKARAEAKTGTTTNEPISNDIKPKHYTAMNKAELMAEIEKRRAEGRVIDISEAKTNPDLVKLLKADDDAKGSSGTGDEAPAQQ